MSVEIKVLSDHKLTARSDQMKVLGCQHLKECLTQTTGGNGRALSCHPDRPLHVLLPPEKHAHRVSARQSIR